MHDAGAKALVRLTTATETGRVSSGASLSADDRVLVFHSDSDFLKEGLPRGQVEIWRYAVATRTLARVTRGAPGNSSVRAAVETRTRRAWCCSAPTSM